MSHHFTSNRQRNQPLTRHQRHPKSRIQVIITLPRVLEKRYLRNHRYHEPLDTDDVVLECHADSVCGDTMIQTMEKWY